MDPFSGKKLVGDLDGFYSVRLTYKDRIVYSVDEKSHTVFVHRARTHYGE
jgi:Txe/YoeB family toxin of Txe-Axe toxin-antitoxin module